MRKYIDRKETPLKWNSFLKYIGIPFAIVIQAAGLYSLFSEVFALNLPLAGKQLTYIINILGINQEDTGNYFWGILAYAGYTIVYFILTVYAWIGLLKWQRYGYRLLLLTYLLAFCRYVFLCYFLSTKLFMVLIYGYAYISSANAQVLKTICIVVIVFGTIIVLLKLLLSGIYYHKRRSLFDVYYQEYYSWNKPQEDIVSIPADGNRSDQVNETPVHEVIEPQIVDAEDQNENTQETITEDQTVSSNMIIPAVRKTNFCPNCGEKIENERMKYCPNCGHAL